MTSNATPITNDEKTAEYVQLFKLVSPYITDIRLMKTIRNDFIIYKEVLKKQLKQLETASTIKERNEKNYHSPEIKLLSLLIYRNVYLTDAERIPNGRSILDHIYDLWLKLRNQNIEAQNKRIREGSEEQKNTPLFDPYKIKQSLIASDFTSLANKHARYTLPPAKEPKGRNFDAKDYQRGQTLYSLIQKLYDKAFKDENDEVRRNLALELLTNGYIDMTYPFYLVSLPEGLSPSVASFEARVLRRHQIDFFYHLSSEDIRYILIKHQDQLETPYLLNVDIAGFLSDPENRKTTNFQDNFGTMMWTVARNYDNNESLGPSFLRELLTNDEINDEQDYSIINSVAAKSTKIITFILKNEPFPFVRTIELLKGVILNNRSDKAPYRDVDKLLRYIILHPATFGNDKDLFKALAHLCFTTSDWYRSKACLDYKDIPDPYEVIPVLEQLPKVLEKSFASYGIFEITHDNWVSYEALLQKSDFSLNALRTYSLELFNLDTEHEMTLNEMEQSLYGSVIMRIQDYTHSLQEGESALAASDPSEIGTILGDIILLCPDMYSSEIQFPHFLKILNETLQHTVCKLHRQQAWIALDQFKNRIKQCSYFENNYEIDEMTAVLSELLVENNILIEANGFQYNIPKKFLITEKVPIHPMYAAETTASAPIELNQL
ncbi:hypothetical protein OZX73_01085 [Bifidobacterium sp. ESL0775]|uniref:YobI family P-loop NTPase n=1 Tax=Bifidobacterium sp. ESL0775 TaxID=2983230 RepID=UPI0023F72248|nr:hypothetical protein [Bifidobacterium sp. ESL0775]WEV69520.1 hypothetical protein OZX73_01085 [Bifidobacterium sp. ESL0775]